MTSVHAIMVLIIRIWAASTIVTVILAFPEFLFSEGNLEREYQYKTYFTANLVVWAVIGVVAWVFAPNFARTLRPANGEESINVTIDSDALVTLGAFLIGGFYLVQYLPSVMTDLGMLVVEASRHDASLISEIDYRKASSVDSVRRLKDGLITLIALWMFLRPVHVARAFSYLRRAGLYKHDIEH